METYQTAVCTTTTCTAIPWVGCAGQRAVPGMHTGTMTTFRTIAATTPRTTLSPQTRSPCRRKTANTQPGWPRSARMGWLSVPWPQQAQVQAADQQQEQLFQPQPGTTS